MKFKDLYQTFNADTNVCIYDSCDTCISDNYTIPPKWIDGIEVASIEILDCDSVRVVLDYCYNTIALDNICEMINDYKNAIYNCKTADAVNDEIRNALGLISDVATDTVRALDNDKPWDYYLD